MTQTTTAPAAAPPADVRLPSPLRIGMSRSLHELRLFFREREAVVFTFSFPIIMLVLFGSIFNEAFEGTGIAFSQVYAAGLIGAGVMSASFQNLGVAIAVERDDGTLKRLVGTPMPRVSYFIGKIGSVLILAVLEVAILLAVSVALFGLRLPSDVSLWGTFCWVFLLGVTASALLGIAVSSIPRSGKSAAAVITLPFVVLQFVSGVFIPASQLPPWLSDIAAIFPLKWMCQGFRSVFLGDAWVAQEAVGSYELGRVALVLLAWVVGGLVLCLMTFRWKSRRDG
ncbi:transport permease protein [Microtetraspora sp. NBRC 13810]|uniref:ABC transporter permease n=1 Tax=Microtetraspora sp. NBRC 13810 TaxID=3030990 RepID=UPI0024A35098|nr:ABC transporter permease [Microtetraspora sp. NBRC 13810]GLW05092.1 transport permease protein [Microtetraspora sp. NBRC 13810]